MGGFLESHTDSWRQSEKLETDGCLPPDLNLSRLNHAEKDASILRLRPVVGKLEAALARIALLEAQIVGLTKPAKTPDNSLTSPSKHPQPNPPVSKNPNCHRRRPGIGRSLHKTLDRVIEAHLAACPNCEVAFPVVGQNRQEVYDCIEFPPIKPDVTRVHLFGGRCTYRGVRATAMHPPD
jgi:hypothetical protein